MASTLNNLAECRAASTDSFSFRECVGLQHQASETLLTGIENSWREYLELSQNFVDTAVVATDAARTNQSSVEQALTVAGSTEKEKTTVSSTDTEAEGQVNATDGQVIAIVSEGATTATSSGYVINISNEALLESDFPSLARDDVADLSLPAQRQRFEILADLYRQYRDESCSWEGGLYGADRPDVYITACKAWLNQERAKAVSLQLSEKRASDSNGTFFSGFYIEDSDGGIFQSCDRRQEWRLVGDQGVLSAIGTRYETIARDNLEMAYLEMRGEFTPDAREDGFSGNLLVRSLNLLRAIDEGDCRSAAERSNPLASADLPGDLDDSRLNERDLSASEPTDLTVDALGASGFLYGYFANWVSACSVEQNSVCLAQVESGYSGLGEWRLVVDRSLEQQWRVQLIPTNSDATIGRAISITVDGAIVGSHPVSGNDATVKAEIGLVLARGDSALQLVNQMRNGQNLTLNWSRPSEIGSELGFSLVGITRALEFFDQNG